MDVKDIALQIATEYAYEELIPLVEFDELLGVTLPTAGSLVFIQAKQLERMTVIDQVAKQLLKEHNLMLHNVRGKGYRLVLPSNQTKVAVHESQHKIGKELLKAKRRVACVRVEELSPSQQREREDALAKLAGIHKLIKA